jgi:hypothetical protein
MDCLLKVLDDLLEHKLTEASFVEPENFGKFCMVFDEMIPQVKI